MFIVFCPISDSFLSHYCLAVDSLGSFVVFLWLFSLDWLCLKVVCFRMLLFLLIELYFFMLSRDIGTLDFYIFFNLSANCCILSCS